MHQRLELSRIVEAIQEIGPSQTVLTTDAIQTWNPPPPELMRMYIASLLQLNIEEEAIRRMIQENPVKILGLDDKLGEGVK
jgi:predicted TIM-barrel fold metal-dependent hydrolase